MTNRRPYRSNGNRMTGSSNNWRAYDNNRRNIQGQSRSSQPQRRKQRYDDYYDDYDRLRQSRTKSDKASTASVVFVFCAIVAVLVLVFFTLKMIKPEKTEAGETFKSVEATMETAEAETAADVEPGTTQITMIADPPVIYGIVPLVVYAGHAVSYKSGIYLKSEVDENPILEVDNGQVDLYSPGTYEVTYIASDHYGNSASEATTITVLDGEEIVPDEKIKAFAKEILNEIIDDEMSDEEKCLEVYKYLHKIGYIDVVHSEDWIQNAYWMLQYRAGDCFGYYAAARLLLTQLGFDVMEIQNNNGFTHYWCLVSIDGGDTWWHFDATCWSWGEDGVLCLVSDQYLEEYSYRHMLSDGCSNHSWDKEKFPATPEYDFWTDEEREVIYYDGELGWDPNGYFDYDSDYWNDYFDYYDDWEWDYEDWEAEEPVDDLTDPDEEPGDIVNDEPGDVDPGYEDPGDYEDPGYEDPGDYVDPGYEDPGDYEDPGYEEPTGYDGDNPGEMVYEGDGSDTGLGDGGDTDLGDGGDIDPGNGGDVINDTEFNDFEPLEDIIE